MISEYRRTPSGHLQLYVRGEPHGPALSRVAICFDQDYATVLKHGCPEAVKQWRRGACSALLRHGELGIDIANAMEIVEGPFEAEELNQAIHVSGHVCQLAVSFKQAA
jgi:hypothetical protein